ncbi:hypothetical protein COCVIDRAFT_32206 [Bipolaris victoriae FI3]|uniref:Uncharacterized protein n=1 Tax=Bipolaris victoriae (strain FI3) TaxID=930091 RepID=W7E315_BIPV3|nr:hypothetical protein COCVIDRAFT_32206 [Bipolaris victoriae FI3]
MLTPTTPPSLTQPLSHNYLSEPSIPHSTSYTMQTTPEPPVNAWDFKGCGKTSISDNQSCPDCGLTP